MAAGNPLVSIQLARAIAALAVALAHIAPEFGSLGLVSPLPAFAEGAAGVDLFFVVSGFVIVLSSAELAGKPGAAAAFARRRLSRIAPLWWAATVVTLLAVLRVEHDLARDDLSWPDAFASLGLLPWPRPSGPLLPVVAQGWTLYFEAFFYAVFAAILALRLGRVWSALAGIAAMIGTAAIFWFHVGLPQPLAYWANPIVLEFAFGIAIWLAFQAGWRIPAWLAGAIAAIGLALLFHPGSTNGGWATLGGREREWGGAAALVVGALALGRWPRGPGFATPAVLLLGDSSYALYLTHGLVYWAARGVVNPAPFAAAHPALYAAGLLALAIDAAIGVFLLFERPMTRLLRGGSVGFDDALERRRLAAGGALAGLVVLALLAPRFVTRALVALP
ncbi:MAG: acyltransferase [Roseiarcus sp.]